MTPFPVSFPPSSAAPSDGCPLSLLPHLPLWVSQGFLETLGVSTQVQGQHHIPPRGPILVVSNHRSFMDPPLVMNAIQRAVHFACHPYMGQVPLMRELVRGLGGFPLSGEGSPSQQLFDEAKALLQQNLAVGVFPEGAAPMVRFTQPAELSPFHRGFAHLALRVPVPELHILPVAIAAREESQGNAVPLQLLSLFDPNEPLFNQSGWHPAIVYRKVNLLIGQPLTITEVERSRYKGRDARELVQDMTQTVKQSIGEMIQQAL